MNNSDTIVANTLKARYFPHSFRSLCSLPPIIEDDRVVWSYDRRGVYMVGTLKLSHVMQINQGKVQIHIEVDWNRYIIYGSF
jgi:hypothetical protein